MAINATPEYEKADQRYRQATTPAEQLDALQEMLRLLPKHKASEKAQMELKRKISVLKKDMASAPKTGGYADPYVIPLSGAGQIAVIGMPNTGKSSILAAVTAAHVKVAEYPYSTAVPTPGMWEWQDVRLQLIDTPPITAEHVPGELVNLLRRADAVVVAVDATSPDSMDQVETVLGLLADKRIELADRPAAEIGPEQPRGKPGLLAITRADAVDPDEIETLAELLDCGLTLAPLDCTDAGGFEEFAGHLWRLLHQIRVYTKRPGQKAEYTDPFTLPAGSTIEDLALHIHRDLPAKLKFARVWGDNHHAGQQVHRTEHLYDKDMVELHE